MNMRFCAVPRVAAVGDVISSLDSIAHLYSKRPSAYVGYDGERPVVCTDRDVVAEDPVGATDCSHALLDGEVDMGERTCPAPVVSLPIGRIGDYPIDHGEYG